MREMVSRITTPLFAIAILILVTISVRAQDVGKCDVYARAVEPKDNIVSGVPDRLLADNLALNCLLRVIEKIKPNEAPGKFSSSDLYRFISATGAIRLIMANADRQDKDNPGSSNLVSLIQQFHSLDNLSVIESLAYGLRQENSDARANSLVILGNVVDNRFLCVFFDHLYDVSDTNDRARANILAVIAVVAPWSYAENYDNACQAVESIEKSPSLESAAGTQKIVANLKDRLNSQTDRTNQSVYLPASLRECYQYKPRNKNVVYQTKRSYRLNCSKVG
jgi:hypothetical protein